MKSDRLRAFFDAFKDRHDGNQGTRARTLLIIQAALIVMLCATVVLVCFVCDRLTFYLILTSSLAVPLVISLVLNLRGHYKAAAWLTILVTIVGPWLCILVDDTVAYGDYVALLYTAMSIQLCAILLNERVTLVIALAQFAGLAALVATNPNLHSFNWPGLMVFIVFVSMLGIISSMMSRKHLQQIEKDRSLLRQSEAKLQELALRDSLTGLFNRRYMEETLERELNRAVREQRNLGVIMTDVDGFKLINDTFGHPLGDAVLARVAEELQHNIRKSDIACRFGGDEFILIMPECSLEDTILRAQALRRIVQSASIVVDDMDVGPVTLSMGVGAMPEHGATAAELLKAADKALYAAKHDGRNRVVTARVAVG